MSRPISDYKKALRLLDELHRDYPSFDLMRHITTATSEYGDPWGMTSRELVFLLNKYRTELELDQVNIVDDAYVNKIVRDSQNFDDILKDNYEDTEY